MPKNKLPPELRSFAAGAKDVPQTRARYQITDYVPPPSRVGGDTHWSTLKGGECTGIRVDAYVERLIPGRRIPAGTLDSAFPWHRNMWRDEYLLPHLPYRHQTDFWDGVANTITRGYDVSEVRLSGNQRPGLTISTAGPRGPLGVDGGTLYTDVVNRGYVERHLQQPSAWSEQEQDHLRQVTGNAGNAMRSAMEGVRAAMSRMTVAWGSDAPDGIYFYGGRWMRRQGSMLTVFNLSTRRWEPRFGSCPLSAFVAHSAEEIEDLAGGHNG